MSPHQLLGEVMLQIKGILQEIPFLVQGMMKITFPDVCQAYAVSLMAADGLDSALYRISR